MSFDLLNHIELSAVPGQSDPLYFLVRYQESLQKGLLIYIQKIGETFSLDLSSLLTKIGSLDLTKRLSPALYFYYSQIKSHYDQKNVEAILHGVQFLKNHLDTPYAQEIAYHSFLSESWEASVINDLKQATPGIDLQKSLYPLIHWSSEEFPPQDFKIALDLIEKLDKNLYKEFATYVSRIKLLSSSLLIACTSPKFFGVIYMRPARDDETFLFYLDAIAHEVSHLQLYAMMGEHQMILNDPQELYSSPLRPDPRPMYGIFHAAFVLARIIRILRFYQKSGGQCEDMLTNKEKRFQESCRIIKEKGQLSESGQKIYQTLELCAFED